MICIYRLTIWKHMAQTPWRVPLIIPLVNLPFGWRPSLVPESVSLTWNHSFLCGAILVHPGLRMLVNWPPPPHSLPIPFSFPQRFPIPIISPSTTTSWHQLHLVQHKTVQQCRENEITPVSVTEILPVLKLVLAKWNILFFLVTFFAVVRFF